MLARQDCLLGCNGMLYLGASAAGHLRHEHISSWLYTSRLYFTANLRWHFTFAQTTEVCCMALLLCDVQEVQTLKATIRDQSAAARRQEAALADNKARLRQLQVRANALQQQH